MANVCRESELSRNYADALAYELECERGPINPERLERARQTTHRRLDELKDFRAWGILPRGTGR